MPTVLLETMGNLYWRQCLFIMKKKNVLGIGVFFDSYLNFTVRVYIRVLVKDLDICKKYEKPTNISLCLI